MAMTDLMYLSALEAYAKLINNNIKTVDDVPEKIIEGGANGVITRTYTFTNIPEVLQDIVKAKILKIDSTYTF